ncbi:MAG: hypothetical protein JSU83_23600 [Deltaproteobacteria bacterium]|nr:MAG: hypothetical protein JSU83_23600 [Deltaproteobacteria bacterium]
MAKWSFKKAKGFDIKVVKPNSYRMWEECERLEYKIFRACGYIPVSKDKRLQFFNAYKRMEFIAAYTRAGKMPRDDKQLLGILRIIYPANTNQMLNEMLPTLRQARRLEYSHQDALANTSLKPPFEDNQTLWLYADAYDLAMHLNPKKCYDWATVGVTQQGQERKVINGIFARAVTRTWAQPPLRYCFIAVDNEVYSRYKAKESKILTLGPSVMYWGSPTVPILIDFHKIAKGIQKLLIPVYRLKGYLGLSI